MSSNENYRLFLEVRDETVRRAIEPETVSEGSNSERRSESEFVEDGVVVRSSDLRSLRAALNGWVRLVSVAEETESIRR